MLVTKSQLSSTLARADACQHSSSEMCSVSWHLNVQIKTQICKVLILLSIHVNTVSYV